MPDVADLLGSAVIQGNQGLGSVGEGIKSAVDIASTIERNQMEKQHLEIQRQQLQEAKLSNFGQAVGRIHDFKDSSARAGYIKFLKAQNQQLEIGIPEESLDFAFAGPENIARVGTLQTMVEDGTLTGPQAIEVLSDPKRFADVVPKSKYAEYKGPDFGAADALQGFDVQDASDKIAKAYAQRQSNDAQAQRAQSYVTNANTKLDEQAASAVRRVHDDQIIKQQVGQTNNIDKGLDLLNDPNNPPSVTRVNEIAQDFSAALSGKGISSDFKLKEINPKTLQGRVQELKQYITSNPDQPAPPAVVAFWRDFGKSLRGAYGRQIGDRAKALTKEAAVTYKNNPAAVEAVKNTAHDYETGKALGSASYDVYGQRMNEAQARAFFKAHPNVQPSPELKKELGL